MKFWNDSDKVASVEGRYNKHVSLDFSNKLYFDSYDHWNLSAEKRVEALNSHFKEFVDKLKTEMKITEFHELGTTTNDIVTIVGRLVNTDPDVAFGNVVELINLSEENESGMSKVKLNFSESQSLALMEGQIVVLEGTSDRDIFNVTNIKPLPIQKPVKENLSMEEGCLSVFVFNGPYTFSDSLNYTALKYIVHLIKMSQPHLVIMGGPFLDINHEFVKEGELFYTREDGEVDCFEDLDFYTAFKSYLDRETEGTQTKIVIIPSPNDMVSMFPFPQPPLSKKDTERVCFLPNPARFTVNGLEFGVVNVDIVRQALSKSFIQNPQKHRLNHIIEEIVRQKSFFPLYPPREDTPVDISQYEKYEMPYAPDVLVTMSELPVFADAIDDKLVFLNPGQATKMKSRGTYAAISINNDSSSSSLSDKLRVEIKNL